MSGVGKRHALPAGLAGEVEVQLRRLGGGQPGVLAALVAAWPSAVGPAVAANAWPARLGRDGAVVVHASSSAWAFELTQLAAEVLDRLGKAAPPRIVFVVGPVPAPGVESVPEACRSRPRPSPADRSRAAEMAREIGPPALREAVARAAAASLAARRTPEVTADRSGTLEET